MDTKTYHGIKVYNGILNQLKNIHDTEWESLGEVRHYANGFPKEIDFNLAQYGNVLVYYHQIAQFYKDCEYPCHKLIDSDGDLDTDKLWSMHKKDVGIVAQNVLNGHTEPIPMRMYKAEIVLSEPVTTLPIMEWIHEHKEDALLLDHTRFVNNSYRVSSPKAVVSMYLRDGTLEDALCYAEENSELSAFEYKGMRRTSLFGCYYFEIDNNVYLCTF